jgi:hypothetical protein
MIKFGTVLMMNELIVNLAKFLLNVFLDHCTAQLDKHLYRVTVPSFIMEFVRYITYNGTL